ncbi:MAG: EAL domain-containing protein [Ruminococcus sp.]|nr:EAL domain-containing protein [Ruminococcus sp.]
MKEPQLFKRIFTTLFCLLFALSCALPSYALSEEKGGEALTVGVPTDRCPIFYTDPDSGEIIGIGAELMRSAAENAGYEVTLKAIKEETLKEALDNEAYDVVMPFGSPIASASGKETIVSDNLLQTPFTLVTDENRKLPELNRLRVGMLRSLGGAAETVETLYPGIEIITYETMPECVGALRYGKVDALLHNSYVWSYVLQKPSYYNLKVQPSAMFSMDFRAGTSDTPDGRALIERLNRGIAELHDTRRQAIILDYTSRRLYRYDFSDYLYQYGLIIILGTLLFASFAVIAVQKVRTVRREHEEKMRLLIDHDSLTQALSLNGFKKRVTELLRDNPDIPYLLAYTNIKNFKYINESLGRAAGDELLRFWADKTAETLSDKEAFCRIESDHFAVLRRAGGEEKIIRDDREVIDSIRAYFTDRGKENRVQICGGVYVLVPEDYRNIDVDKMLDFARLAEKRIHSDHKDGYEFYNPDQWEIDKKSSEIISHLTAAIKAGEIQVWYQPQVEYNTGRIIGAEALCRWKHTKLGWISPAEFIPVLEEAGLIYELDIFVWNTVCRELQNQNRQGLHRSVSVNLSRYDIKENPDIPEYFRDLIKAYDLSPDQLRLEITETVYVENPEILISATERLRKYGFQVEMDDFGSGCSSLNMLKEVPVNCIKLDLHFLTESGDSEKSRVIVSYIVQMAKAMGMELIAEGVETAEQAEFLQSCGCTVMQGYYFYKPMPLEEFNKICEINAK